MSGSFQDTTATLTAELKKFTESAKEQFGIFGRKLDDHEQRMADMKKDLLGREEVKEVIKQLMDAASTDPNREIRMLYAPTSEKAIVREIMGRQDLSARQVRGVYDVYLMSQPNNEKTRRYHQLSSQLTLLRAYVRRGDPSYQPASSQMPEVIKLWAEYRDHQRELFGDDFLARAFDTSNASEWVPEIFTSELLRFLEIVGNVIPNIDSFNMPAGEYRWPTTTAAARGRRVAETTSLPSGAFDYSSQPMYADASEPTANVLFSANKLRAFIGVSSEFEEESIVPAIPFITQEVGLGILRSLEDAIFNGGTVANLPDDGLVVTAGGDGSFDSKTLWKGIRERIRERTSAATADAGGSFTVAAYVSARKKMGKYAENPGELRAFASPAGMIDMIDTPEFLTLDKLGPRATVATGMVGDLLGTPLFVSDRMRDDVSATGFRTAGGPNTFTSVVIIDRRSWKLGNFRGVTTERDRIVPRDLNFVFAWWRGDFQKMRPTGASGEPSEAAVVNISAS